MKKFGFTISEILISMVIIGILSGAIIGSFKKNDKSIKYLYSSTYHSLDRALYNATTFWVGGNIKDREPFKRKVAYTDASTGEEVDVEINDAEAARRLCVALTTYINTTNASCHASETNDTGEDDLFSSGTIQFTATNGVRYWISKRYPAIPKEGEPDNDNDLKFFIIYADLNGAQRPNSMDYERGSEDNEWHTKDPDIFAFAALETGRICPLGVPEVEPRYMTTRIVYEELDDNNQIILRYSEPSRPYAYSKGEAWGYYLNGADQGYNNVLDTDVINEEPLSYNGYVKSKIDKDSKIYAFLSKNEDGNRETMRHYVQNDPNNLDPETQQFNIRFRNDPPRYANNDPHHLHNIGGYSCQWMSDEECYIIVDKYLY